MDAANSEMPQWTRQLAAGAATVLASVVLSLLVLEVGVRIADGVPLISTENFVGRDLDTVHKQGKMSVYDARLGWTTIPNVSWSVEGKRVTAGIYTFGDYGVRMSTPHVAPLEKGAILVVGDSFGVGSEVADAESWPAQLESMVGGRVINAAAGGYGLDQIVLRAEELLSRLEPRTLLVQTRLEFGLSVLRMTLYGGTPKPYFTIEDGRLALHNEPVPRLASRGADIGWARAVLGHSYLVQYLMARLDLMQWWVSPSMATKYALPVNQAVDVSCLLMRRLAQMRDRTGIKVVLVFQYAGPDGLDSKLGWHTDRDRVLACSEQEGLEVVDVLDALRTVYRGGDLASYQRLWIMHDNNQLYGHMSAEGNRLVADLVAQQLAKLTARSQ